MRAKFMLLAPIVCVVVGACGSPGAPRVASPAAAASEAVDWGPARYIPHDYPGPGLRGGGGGG
jgi:hypothetical protein